MYVYQTMKSYCSCHPHHHHHHHSYPRRSRAVLYLVESAGAAPQVAVLEVVQVDPGVGGVLLPFDHGSGLVVRAVVLRLQVVVHHTGPQEGLPFTWLDYIVTSNMGIHYDTQHDHTVRTLERSIWGPRGCYI